MFMSVVAEFHRHNLSRNAVQSRSPGPRPLRLSHREINATRVPKPYALPGIADYSNLQKRRRQVVAYVDRQAHDEFVTMSVSVFLSALRNLSPTATADGVPLLLVWLVLSFAEFPVRTFRQATCDRGFGQPEP